MSSWDNRDDDEASHQHTSSCENQQDSSDEDVLYTDVLYTRTSGLQRVEDAAELVSEPATIAYKSSLAKLAAHAPRETNCPVLNCTKPLSSQYKQRGTAMYITWVSNIWQIVWDYQWPYNLEIQCIDYMALYPLFLRYVLKVTLSISGALNPDLRHVASLLAISCCQPTLCCQGTTCRRWPYCSGSWTLASRLRLSTRVWRNCIRVQSLLISGWHWKQKRSLHSRDPLLFLLVCIYTSRLHQEIHGCKGGSLTLIVL